MSLKTVFFAMAACPFICAYAQNIELRGVVREAKTKAPIEFANIVLHTEDSVFVAGSVSAANGSFVLGGLKSGAYIVTVSAMGYEKQQLSIKEMKSNRTLPDIMLEETSIALEGVTVSGSSQINRIDRKLVYPSDRQMKASTNGLDLLWQLMLPKLIIDPIKNEAKLPGGGVIQYRINGVKVEINEVIALMPADIIRIEYHDNPGMRYGNAEVVLDYIVRRPETGGSLGLNLGNGLTGTWGNNSMNGRINHKKSEIYANGNILFNDFYQVWRDNEERFQLADGSILERKEAGSPDNWSRFNYRINAGYSFQNDNRIINVLARFNSNSTPHENFTGLLYNTANPTDRVNMTDRTSYSYTQPALDLYYQENLKRGQTVMFNIVGTYNSTTNSRTYREERDGHLLADIENDVKGEKLSLIAEGNYEKKLSPTSRITTGIKHTSSQTDNRYASANNYTTRMTQSETDFYAELRGKLKKFDYSIATGFTHWYYFQKEVDSRYNRAVYGIKVTLQYTLPDNSTIRLMGSNGNSMPSLTELSAVDQSIDSLQIRRGNPYLKPYNRFRGELTYNTRRGILNADFWTFYEYLPGAIMEEKFIENGKIVQTWDNQRDWQRISTRLSLRLGPIANILQLSAEGGINHYISNGNTYRHLYTNYYFRTGLSASYKNFAAFASVQAPWNNFYGESMSGNEKYHEMGLSYKHRSLSIGLAVICPFADNYKIESENRSQYASYRRSFYINESSRFVIATLVWNTSFGRKFNSAQKRVNNADEGAGIMNSGK